MAESFEGTLKRITSSVEGINTLHANAAKQFSSKSAVNDKLKEIGKIQQTAVDSNKVLGSLLDEKKASGVDSLVARLHNTAALAYKATTEIEKLTAAIAGYNAMVKNAGGVNFKFLRDTPGGSQQTKKDGGQSIIPFADVTGKGKKDSLVDELLDKSAFFMLRYRLYSSIFEGAMYAVNDILMGRARQDLAKQLGELTAVAFNSSQRKEAEVAAQIYSTKFWNTTTEEYVKAMAMTATAFDVNKIGFKNLERMNEAAIGMSKISQMTADKSAELMTGMIMQIMSRLPEDARQKLQAGESTFIKGYGEKNLGGIAETIAAQSAKAIQVATIKGSGIASAFRHALPVMLEQGWDVAAGLSFVSMMKNMGFHEGQIGRGTKDMMITAPTDFAKAVLYGSTDKYGQTYFKEEGFLDGQGQVLDKKGAKEWNDKAVNILSGKIRKSFGDPEEYSKMMVLIGQKISIAQSKGIDLVKELGLSKDFLAQILAYTQPGAQAVFQAIRQEIDKADISEMTQMVIEQLNDAGTAWIRISNAFNNLFQTMADTEMAHGIAVPIADAVNYTNFYHKYAKYYKGWSSAWAKEDFEAKYEKNMIDFFGAERTNLMKDRLMQQGEEHWRRKWITLEMAAVGAIAGTLAGGPLFGTLLGAGAGMLLGDQSYTMDRLWWSTLPKRRKDEEDSIWGYKDEFGDVDIKPLAAYLKMLNPWNWGEDAKTMIPFFPNFSKIFEKTISPFEAEFSDLFTMPFAIVKDIFENGQSAFATVSSLLSEAYSYAEKIGQLLKDGFAFIVDLLNTPVSTTIESLKTKLFGQKDPNMSTTDSREWGWTDNPITEFFGQKYDQAKSFLGGDQPSQSPASNYADIDTTLGAAILNAPEQLPQLLPNLPISMPLTPVPIQMSSADETPIHIENRLILDGRELAYAVAEIIQRNRSTNFMGFGADPFGYNVG